MHRSSLLQLRCLAFSGVLGGCEPVLDVGSWVAGADPSVVSTAMPPPAVTDPELTDAAVVDTAVVGTELVDAAVTETVANAAAMDAAIADAAAMDAAVADAASAVCTSAVLPIPEPINDAGEPLVWTTPIAQPWSTGFEDGFCGYAAAQGFCYASPDASFELVTTPVHTGQFAAAFNVTSDAALDGTQTRCVRQGVLPTAAYYGAWYFIPLRSESGNRNLFYFQGGEASDLRGLWDVSLNTGTDGEHHFYVFDFLGGQVHEPTGVPPVPIGAWFHVEVFLRRAADPSGEMALYQDGQLLLQLQNIVTDDSAWAQWYVGNFSNSLVPADSTIYVDDVTIRESR